MRDFPDTAEVEGLRDGGDPTTTIVSERRTVLASPKLYGMGGSGEATPARACSGMIGQRLARWNVERHERSCCDRAEWRGDAGFLFSAR